MPTKTIRRQLSFGGRVRPEIGLLIALTAIVSIVGALAEGSAFAFWRWLRFSPAPVFEGQVWRLVTATFVETSPISLVFACLFIYWFGRDLAGLWGVRNFVLRYLGIPLVAYGVTALVGLFSPTVMGGVWSGSWPVAEALIIFWAAAFPDRQMLLYFVLPIGGRRLIWLTVGLLVLFAIYMGPIAFIPHFVAVALALVASGTIVPLRSFYRLRNRMKQERLRNKTRRGHLRVVPDGDDEERKERPKFWN